MKGKNERKSKETPSKKENRPSSKLVGRDSETYHISLKSGRNEENNDAGGN